MAGFSIVRLRPKFNFFLFLVIYSGTLFPFQMYLIPVYRDVQHAGPVRHARGHDPHLLRHLHPVQPLRLSRLLHHHPARDRGGGQAGRLRPGALVLSVFLPQSLPPTAVVALFQATWIWNDLLFGMVLSRQEQIRPIMVAVATMTGYGGGNIPWIMTAVIFTSIPTILLFVAPAQVLHPGNGAQHQLLRAGAATPPLDISPDPSPFLPAPCRCMSGPQE